MATRLYLHVAAASDPPTAGDKSSALPSGTANANSGASFESLSMNTSIGSSETSKTRTSLAQTADQDGYICRFTTTTLDVNQTISANTWTFSFAADSANANANAFIRLSIYVWRPSSSSVVGYMWDSHSATTGETEWNDLEGNNNTVTVSGSSVSALAGDVIVCEVWYHAAQSKTTAYLNTFYFDGNTAGGDSPNSASYLETPQNLTFGTPATGKGFPFRATTPRHTVRR